MSPAPPDPPVPDEPRLPALTRRTLLVRAAAGGALVALPGLACGHDDASVFAEGETVRIAPTTGGSPTTSATPSDPVETTSPSATESTTTTEPATAGSSTAADVTSTTSSTSPAVVPDGAELIVSFTYQPTRGGGENPYLAVWIEDTAGELVDTIAVWFDQGARGQRWLDDLVQWYAASDRGTATTVSGATRVAGSYTVAWDVTDLAGGAIAPGDYVLHVEAVREDGPYSITSSPITIGAAPAIVDLADATELVGVAASLEI